MERAAVAIPATDYAALLARAETAEAQRDAAVRALTEIASHTHSDVSCSLEAQGYNETECAEIAARQQMVNLALIALGKRPDHPVEHIKYLTKPAIIVAIERMIANETSGGDGWWNAWADVKEAARLPAATSNAETLRKVSELLNKIAERKASKVELANMFDGDDVADWMQEQAREALSLLGEVK